MSGYGEGEFVREEKHNSNFALVVVLFILLIIVGASFMSY